MHDVAPFQAVDYLVIGHITQDLTSGSRMGGTAAFSALTARALGLRVGIVTSTDEQTSLKALDGIPIVSVPSGYPTTFENIYSAEEGRRQILHHQAAHIPFDLVPGAWRSTAIIHLGPVAQELDPELPADFSPSLLGVTPPCKWQNAESMLTQAGAVVISREDVGGDEEWIEAMAHQTRVLAVTEAAAGAVLYWNGDRRRFRAPQVEEVDATGAGDIFAASFFIRLQATRDPWEAARFATQLSARSVTRTGLDGIPARLEIEECLMEVF